jgi:hypothetical protein
MIGHQQFQPGPGSVGADDQRQPAGRDGAAQGSQKGQGIRGVLDHVDRGDEGRPHARAQAGRDRHAAQPGRHRDPRGGFHAARPEIGPAAPQGLHQGAVAATDVEERRRPGAVEERDDAIGVAHRSRNIRLARGTRAEAV